MSVDATPHLSPDFPPILVNGELPKPLPHPSLRRMSNDQLLDELMRLDAHHERHSQLKTEVIRRMNAWKYREVSSAPPLRATKAG